MDNGIGDPCMGAVGRWRIWHFGFGQFCKGPNYKAEEQPAFTLICCINSPFVGNPFDNLANGEVDNILGDDDVGLDLVMTIL